MAEAWVTTYKRECVQRRLYASYEHAEHDALDFIGFYNHERLHQALGYRAPLAYEALSDPDRVSPVAARRQATTRASGEKQRMEEKNTSSTPVDTTTPNGLPWPDTLTNEGDT